MSIKLKRYKILIIILSISVSLILAESIINIVKGPQIENTFWISDRQYLLDLNLIYKLKKNYSITTNYGEFNENLNTNEFGMRGKKREKQDNDILIIVFGDSFTYGYGLNDDETYPFLLESELKSQKGKNNYSVFNAGIPGYSPDQVYRYIPGSFDLKPNIILWGLTAWDLEDLIKYSPGLYGYDNNGLHFFPGWANWLYVGNLIFERMPKAVKNSHLVYLIHNQLLNINFLNNRRFSGNNVEVWAKNKLLTEIIEIDKKARENNIKFILLILPTRENLTKDNLIKDADFGLIKEKLNSLNILYLDIAENDLSNELGIKSFFKDGHLNRTGMEITADIISSYLLKKPDEKDNN